MYPPLLRKPGKGFTLAELLIALAILGVIATFSIPKILSAQQNAANNAKAKEVASMISGAYQKLQLSGGTSASTKPSDLLPYMNYTQLITDGRTIDSVPTLGSETCNNTTPCVLLHNGGVLLLYDAYIFGGTGSNYTIAFIFDPDGTYSGSAADGPAKAIQFNLYYNGFITTRGQIKPGTCSNGSCGVPYNTAYDPSWFSF